MSINKRTELAVIKSFLNRKQASCRVLKSLYNKKNREILALYDDLARGIEAGAPLSIMKTNPRLNKAVERREELALEIAALKVVVEAINEELYSITLEIEAGGAR